MKKSFLGLLLFLNVNLLSMQKDATHAILDGFDWNAADFFSLEDFCEMKQKDSFKLAVLTTDDGSGKWSKAFCSAQEFAKYVLTKKAFINPTNKQNVLGLAVLTYSKKEDGFKDIRYYDIGNWFKYMYDTLSTADLPNRTVLLYSRACVDVANHTKADYLRASYRNTAYAHLVPILADSNRTPVEEQDACMLLVELHIRNTPSTLKDFKSVEYYAQRVLDLQKAIKRYVHENPVNHVASIFTSREPLIFAQLMLGKIYSIGGHGVHQNIPEAYNYLERVINDPYAHNYYHNEALLTRAALLYKHAHNAPLPWFMRIKRVRNSIMRRDLQNILQNDPSSSQQTQAQHILEEMF